MTQSIRVLNLLDQLKVQVLLYSGTLIDYRSGEGDCLPLLNTAVALGHDKVDQVLLNLEQETGDSSCVEDVASLLAPVYERAGFSIH